MPPDVGSTRVGHFELEMIRQALAAQVKTDFECLRQLEPDHPPHHHESSAAVEIIVEPQPTPSLLIRDAGYPPFRLPGGDDLPCFRIGEEVEKRMIGHSIRILPTLTSMELLFQNGFEISSDERFRGR